MNTKSLFYFVEAAKDMNFTQTAKRLYISQQALSQHIGKLESQYGVPLFVRKPQLGLSYAGKTLLPHAERLLHEEKLVESMFSDIADQERGHLRVSVTIPRCRLLLTDVIPAFKKRYPNVVLDVINPSTSSALDMVVKGEAGMAIGLLTPKHQDLQLVPLTDDPWYVLIPESLLREHYDQEYADRIVASPDLELAEIIKLPVISANELSSPEGVFPDIYNGLTPNTLFTSSCPQNFLEFPLAGLSCMMVGRMALQIFQDRLPEHVLVRKLRIGGDPSFTSVISLAYNKARHMPPYGDYFISLVRSFFSNYNQERQ